MGAAVCGVDTSKNFRHVILLSTFSGTASYQSVPVVRVVDPEKGAAVDQDVESMRNHQP